MVTRQRQRRQVLISFVDWLIYLSLDDAVIDATSSSCEADQSFEPGIVTTCRSLCVEPVEGHQARRQLNL